MAKRLLVPLDPGTPADIVVPLVADMARGAGATVRLLHVAPVPDNVVGADGRVVAYVDQEMARLDAYWRDYLLQTAPAHLEGVAVESAVRFGEPVAEILAEAEAFGAELIVVATKARSSMSRALLGSVAEAVLSRAPAAVMLVRPPR